MFLHTEKCIKVNGNSHFDEIFMATNCTLYTQRTSYKEMRSKLSFKVLLGLFYIYICSKDRSVHFYACI